MGYKIIKDNVHKMPEEAKWCKVGYLSVAYKGGKHRFRLLDDDGEIYFYGLSDSDSSFAPLNWSSGLWGCTEIQYRNPETKEYETL
jgi:hypothetical protein